MSKLKYLLALALLLLAGQAGANPHFMALSGPTVGSSDPYPDIIFYWGCETDTAEKAGGDSSASYASAAALDAGLKIVGNKSLDCPTGLDFATFGYLDNINPDAGRFGCYFYVETWLSGVGLFDLRIDGDNQIYANGTGVDGVGTRELTARVESQNTASQPTTITADLLTGQWYFVEIAWDRAADYVEIFVDGVSVKTSASDCGPGFVGAFTNLRLGNIGAVLSDSHYDQFLISTDKTRDLNALKDLTSF